MCAAQSLRLAGVRDYFGSTLAMPREGRRNTDDLDVIHFHLDLLPQALYHELADKCLVTLLGRLDSPDNMPLYEAHLEMPPVSISNAQRRPMPADANWLAARRLFVHEIHVITMVCEGRVFLPHRMPAAEPGPKNGIPKSRLNLAAPHATLIQ